MAAKKYNIHDLQSLRQQWQEIPIEAIPEKNRSLYQKRKEAVDMYIDGYGLLDIERITGISQKHISTFIKKCLITSQNEMYGYQALIPNVKLGKSHSVGRFLQLLEQYPSLSEFITGNYFGNKKYTLEKNMNLTTLHEKFLSECLRLGIQQHEYPFNTANRGYVSLCKYVRKIAFGDINKQAVRESENNRQKLRSTGIGKRYTTNTFFPFDVVQIDGHVLDLIYNIKIMNSDNTIHKTTATRAWMFAVIYKATKNEKYLELAKEGAKYLQGIAVGDENAVLIPYQDHPVTVPTNDKFYLSTCHGPAGHTLLFRILYEITGEQEYLDWFKRISRGTIRAGAPERFSWGFWNAQCQCCGTAGILEHFVHAYEFTKDEEFLEYAKRTAKVLLSDSSVSDEAPDQRKWYGAWTRTIPDKVVSYAGLYVGSAGCASALLSLYATDHRIRLTQLFEYAHFATI